MATENFIGLPADGTGKKLRTQEVVEGSNTVQQEVLTLADKDGNLIDSSTVTDDGKRRLAVGSDIKALTTWATNRLVVGTTAQQIAAAPLAGRRTISIQMSDASPNNSHVWIGNSNGVTSTTGRELSLGGSIDLDLADTLSDGVTVVEIWVIGSVANCVVSWAEIGD